MVVSTAMPGAPIDKEDMKKILLDDKLEELLYSIPLFRDLPKEVKMSLLKKLEYSVHTALRKDIIAYQGTACKKLYVLLEGKLRVDIIDGLGNKVMIEYIVAPRAFATPHLFSTDGTLPATFTAVEDCTLFTASRESTFNLISGDPKILHSFLCVSGNCNACTVARLKMLSRKTVRERFVVYLCEQRKKGLVMTIAHTQSELAEYLNVTRPALSKEINKMVKEGVIRMEGKRIEVLRESALNEYM